MVLERPSVSTLELRDVGFGLAWLLAVLVLLPAQLTSMILFDSTGLDVLTPVFVFMVVVPSVAVALLPTLVARKLYARSTTRVTAVVATVTFAAIAAYLLRFYGMCGGLGC